MAKAGDRILLVDESWPAPGYDAGYIGDVVVDGREVGQEDIYRVEKLLPPRWFQGKVMEISEVRQLPTNTLYIVERTVTITLKLKLLEREFEVIDGKDKE